MSDVGGTKQRVLESIEKIVDKRSAEAAETASAVLVARETERLWSGVRESVEVGGSSKGCGFGFSEAWPEGLKGFEEC